MVKSSSPNRGKYKKLDFYKLGVTLKDLRDMKLMRLWRQLREAGWILDLVEEMGWKIQEPNWGPLFRVVQGSRPSWPGPRTLQLGRTSRPSWTLCGRPALLGPS